MANLALFDFDGTITVTGTWMPFIERAVEPRRMAVGKVVLSPLIAAYGFGALSSSRMREWVVWFGLRARQAAEIRAFGLEFSRTEVPKVVRPEALERIHWHKAQGDVVVVVSASIDVYLSDWSNSLGLDLICSELEEAGGVLTGRYVGGDCSGTEKARRVREKYDLGAHPVVYAYGDTSEDEEMLRLANRKYFRWRAA